jgi:hypothetical protein
MKGDFLKYIRESQMAFGYTTVDEGRNEPPHRHQFKVDKQGNGITSENGDSVHTHMIVMGQVHYANGHQHSMGPAMEDQSEFRTGDEFGNDLGVHH